MKVSVIIPVHNSEKYLKECMESVLAQSFQDIEVLCIDGGSIDSTFEIIKGFQEQDGRIVYIQDPNTSYGHKINVGMDRARGEYIAILESDDRMDVSMLEKLYGIAKRYGVDIVDADYYDFFNHQLKEFRVTVKKYPNPEIYNRFMRFADGEDRAIAIRGIWTALYRKRFLEENRIRLNESAGAAFQDISFMFVTSLLVKTAYHLDEPVYYYRVDNAGSSVKDDKKVFEIIGECNYLKMELVKRGIQDRDIWLKYYTRKYSAFYWNYSRLTIKSREVFLEKYLEELEKDIQDGWVERKNFIGTLYDYTFSLIDDRGEFVNKVLENDKRITPLEILEVLERVKEREIVIFGAGVWGKKTIDILRHNGNILCGVCDNSSTLKGKKLGDMKIYSVEETVRKHPNAFYLVTSYKYREEMKRQLLAEGIQDTDMFVF